MFSSCGMYGNRRGASQGYLNQSYFNLEAWQEYFYKKLEDLKKGLLDSPGFCMFLGLSIIADGATGWVFDFAEMVRESGLPRGYFGHLCG